MRIRFSESLLAGQPHNRNWHLVAMAAPPRRPEGVGGAAPQPPDFLVDLRKDTKIWQSYRPAIERSEQLIVAARRLIQDEKNSVIFFGNPGVGKTALLYTVARKIVDGEIPQLSDRGLYKLDLNRLTSGVSTPGEVAQRIQILRDYLGQLPGQAIIFVDEIQQLFRIQGVAGPIIDGLMEDLGADRLTLLGTSAEPEFLNKLNTNSALKRRIQMTEIPDMSAESTLQVLRYRNDENQRRFSAKAKMPVKIPDGVLTAAVKLAGQYVKDRYFPDKALDMVSDACSARVTAALETSLEIEAVIEQIKIQFDRALQATANQNQEDLGKAKKEIISLATRYHHLKETNKAVELQKEIIITEDDILDAVSRASKIPRVKLREDEQQKLLELEQRLAQRVIGQDLAKGLVANAVRKARALPEAGKPVGSFLFAGPTGVGKTELAKALAEILFGDESALIRIDMEQHKELHSVARLLGTHPGYVGFEQGGELTNAVRNRPYAVCLLDEIEKAHPELWDTLLPVFDDARVKDNRGKVVDFTNVVFIATSNLAAREIRDALHPVKDPQERQRIRKELFEKALRARFKPEFVARLTDVVYFTDLDQDAARQVLTLKIAKLQKQVGGLGFQVEITTVACEQILQEGYNVEMGFRPLDNALSRLVREPLGKKLIAGEYPPRSIIKVDGGEQGLTFTQVGTIPVSSFEMPKVEGNIGVVVYRLFSALEQQSQAGGTSIDKTALEELLHPKDERVREALNKVVQAGAIPTGSFILTQPDPARKDPAIITHAQNMQRLAQAAGFGEIAVQAVFEFAYHLSIYAKRINAEFGSATEPSKVAWNFDGDNLYMTVQARAADGSSVVRQKLEANFCRPTPDSRETSPAIFTELGKQGDLSLIELKRKIGEARASAGVEFESRGTTFYARFRLFEQPVVALEEDVDLTRAEAEVLPEPASPPEEPNSEPGVIRGSMFRGREPERPDFEDALEEVMGGVGGGEEQLAPAPLRNGAPPRTPPRPLRARGPMLGDASMRNYLQTMERGILLSGEEQARFVEIVDKNLTIAHNRQIILDRLHLLLGGQTKSLNLRLQAFKLCVACRSLQESSFAASTFLAALPPEVGVETVLARLGDGEIGGPAACALLLQILSFARQDSEQFRKHFAPSLRAVLTLPPLRFFYLTQLHTALDLWLTDISSEAKAEIVSTITQLLSESGEELQRVLVIWAFQLRSSEVKSQIMERLYARFNEQTLKTLATPFGSIGERLSPSEIWYKEPPRAARFLSAEQFYTTLEVFSYRLWEGSLAFIFTLPDRQDAARKLPSQRLLIGEESNFLEWMERFINNFVDCLTQTKSVEPDVDAGLADGTHFIQACMDLLYQADAGNFSGRMEALDRRLVELHRTHTRTNNRDMIRVATSLLAEMRQKRLRLEGGA